ncbi:MAG: transposase family protein, partial [Nitrososphaerota archaeon]|nr:transposase family protein [Nitrososphaerota archaeon]
MENLLENLTIINQADTRQQGKNKYQLNEIIGITFSAMTANTNDFQEIAAFTQIYHTQRQQYFPNMKKPQPRHHPTRLRHARPSLPPNLPNPIQPTTKPKRKPKNQKTPPLDGKTQKGNKTKT